MKHLTYKKMLAATLRHDADWDGKFFVGVKTMKIYCLPSCRAKLPLIKNLVFFRGRAEAIAAGFRGCKRCKAESFPNVSPAWLMDFLAFMKKERTGRISAGKLVALAGVDISTIRRRFKSQFQTTPMSYHRKLRLAHARKMIEEGANYLTAAYECGYESASGFREAFIKEYGLPPGKYYASRTNRL
jgi:AraC family transcriptional regulator of adaptative response/methylated-DNA-[protein]-cysteine methyltransferase